MALKIRLKAVEIDGKVDLWLSDNEGNIGVNDLKSTGAHGQEVLWLLPSDSNIKRIVNIYKKEDSETVFSIKPFKVLDGKWQAVVAEEVVGTEVYNIDFEYMDGSIVSIDPVIDVPPRG